VTDRSAAEELARLAERSAQAGTRTRDLEQAQRSASQALAAARSALVEAERRGDTAALPKLEKALADAEARAAQPWRERIEGARRAAADADQERRLFIGANMDELVEQVEVAGEAITATFNATLEALVRGYEEWHKIERQLIGLASALAPMRPGDVSRSKSEAIVREAQALLMAGGEQPPRLLHRPGQPRHGQVAERVSA
jgi:hypothetical protein